MTEKSTSSNYKSITFPGVPVLVPENNYVNILLQYSFYHYNDGPQLDNVSSGVDVPILDLRHPPEPIVQPPETLPGYPDSGRAGGTLV